MLPALGAAEPDAAEGAAPAPGTTRKREGAPRRCNSWRMIFSAAAFTVSASIFLPIPGTSMRTEPPSCVKLAARSSSEADLCPALSSALTTALRSVSGSADPAEAGSGALASAPSVRGSAWTNPVAGTAAAGKGAATGTAGTIGAGAGAGISVIAGAAAMTGATVGAAIAATGAGEGDAGLSGTRAGSGAIAVTAVARSAAGAGPALSFVAGADPQLPDDPNGEAEGAGEDGLGAAEGAPGADLVGAGEEREGAGGAEVRDEAGAVPPDATTPLSNSSIGSSRCA